MTTVSQNPHTSVAGSAAVTPIDAHVHFHAAFDRREFLDAAAANMVAAGGDAEGIGGVLMFADPRAYGNPLEMWRKRTVHTHRWRIEPLQEPESLIARREDGVALVLIAGRQLVTTEGLEILAMATVVEFLTRRPLRETIEHIRSAGAVPAVPWGFGKWWGMRGRILIDAIENTAKGTMMMVDSGTRPSAGREHLALRVARSAGVPVLAGTDPLPLRSQVRRIGSFGFLMPGRIDPAGPAAHIRRYLAALRESPVVYGRRDSTIGFVTNQISLRMRGREGMLVR